MRLRTSLSPVIFLLIILGFTLNSSSPAFAQADLKLAELTNEGQVILPLSEDDAFGIHSWTAHEGDSIVSITVNFVNVPNDLGLTVRREDFLFHSEVIVYNDERERVFPADPPEFIPLTGGEEGQFAIRLRFRPAGRDTEGNLIPGDLPIPVAESDDGATDFFVAVKSSEILQDGVEFYLQIGEQMIVVDQFEVPPPNDVMLFPRIGEIGPPKPGWFVTDHIAAVVLPPTVLDLLPVPGNTEDPNLDIGRYPGYFDDNPGAAPRYMFSPPAMLFRTKYAGEFDLKSGIMGDYFERFYFLNFELPEEQPLERRFAVIGLEVIGGTSEDPLRLRALTVTFTNHNSAGKPVFMPFQDLDPIRWGDSQSTDPYFSGLTVYKDSDGGGEWDEVGFNAGDFSVDPGQGDQPVLLDPDMGLPYEVRWNQRGTVWSVTLFFAEDQGDRNTADVTATGKPNFFVVLRMDSGMPDDSGYPPDYNGIDFGGRFKVSLERAEDLNNDGDNDDVELGEADFNGDGLAQRYPVILADSSGALYYPNLVILADNSGVENLYREIKPVFPVFSFSDLSTDFGFDENFPHPRIRQMIDATSPPTPLIGINACSSNVPQVGFASEPPTMDSITLQFDGSSATGFDPGDIQEIILFRDDKSPFFPSPSRNIGVFDLLNDTLNNPAPGFLIDEFTNPAETSPILLSPYEIVDVGNNIYEVRLATQGDKPEIYRDDLPESPGKIDSIGDNFAINPITGYPENVVFWGDDYFICIRTSDSISYGDVIRPRIPMGGIRTSRGIVYAGTDEAIDPEVMAELRDSGIPLIDSLAANVPVILHDLVPPEALLERNSGYVPVIGIDTFTNRPSLGSGGERAIDVYLEQLFVQFIEAGNRIPKSLNLQYNGDFKPYINVNGENSAASGIRLKRRINGSDYVIKFASVDPVLEAQGLENPSHVGPEDVGNQGILMIFNTDDTSSLNPEEPSVRDLLRIPENNAGPFAGDDFIIEIATSENFDPNADNFSVAIISWGPESPAIPKPYRILTGQTPTKENTAFEALNHLQTYESFTRGIGFIDSNWRHSRSFETINTNAFNATRATALSAVGAFHGSLCDENVDDPTRQVLLTWDDVNTDNPVTPFIDENESGYWIEADIFGYFQPLPGNPVDPDMQGYLFSGPPFLSGRTAKFRVFPFRDNIMSQPLEPPFNGLGPTATTSVTFAKSLDLAPPLADFADPLIIDCSPLTVQFIDESLYGPNEWQWDFGDGDTSSEQNPSHAFTGPGTYDVCLTVANGCGSSMACNSVTVKPVMADFAATQLSGCSPLKVDFLDRSQFDLTEWAWDFGDGHTSSERDPSHVYETPGCYSVSLSVSGPCGSDTKTIDCYVKVESISLSGPADGSVFDQPPTFTWDDECGNRFVLEFSGSADFSTAIYKTPVLSGTSLTVPLSWWNRVPRYTWVYWRVKGADISIQPLTVHTSEVRKFRKD